jgi:phage tail-like protein
MALTELPLGFRFGVSFFVDASMRNPVDLRFQRVSGLSASIQIKTHAEGGQNLYAHRLPEPVTYGNLVLERSMEVKSPLIDQFVVAMSQFKFTPSNVQVRLLNADKAPIAAWMFISAFPVQLSTSELDAGQEGIIIDTMELAYARMVRMKP